MLKYFIAARSCTLSAPLGFRKSIEKTRCGRSGKMLHCPWQPLPRASPQSTSSTCHLVERVTNCDVDRSWRRLWRLAGWLQTQQVHFKSGERWKPESKFCSVRMGLKECVTCSLADSKCSTNGSCDNVRLHPMSDQGKRPCIAAKQNRSRVLCPTTCLRQIALLDDTPTMLRPLRL